MRKQYVRLQKMLADCGVASRRKSEELIRNGVVKVNGKVAEIGDKVAQFLGKAGAGDNIDGQTVGKSVKIHRFIPTGVIHLFHHCTPLRTYSVWSVRVLAASTTWSLSTCSTASRYSWGVSFAWVRCITL